jgi:hypothetical protein
MTLVFKARLEARSLFATLHAPPTNLINAAFVRDLITMAEHLDEDDPAPIRSEGSGGCSGNLQVDDHTEHHLGRGAGRAEVKRSCVLRIDN